MTPKYTMCVIGAATLLSLTPCSFAKAQAQQLASFISTPTAHKVTAEELKARLAESKAKHPLLHQRLLPTKAKHDSIVRLNRNIEAGIKMGQAGKNPFILRANNDETKTLWGNVLFDNTWDDNVQYGMYSFKTKAPITTTKLFGDDFCRATGAGAWIENELYFVMYQNFWGIDMVYLYKYDTDTWTQLQEERLDDFTLVASETAIADDGTVYGCFLDAEGVNSELGVADYANKTRSTIGRLKHAYVAMGITKDNVLYGVASDGNLYRIDTATAEETLIGSTGKQLTKSDGSYYYQSGEIDQATNTFYWDCVDADQKSTLYTVDLATGQLTEIGDFANNEIISLLTIPKAKAADGAPATASDLTFDFADGALTGDICFKAPSLTFGGSKLTDETLSYTILLEGNEIVKGTTAPGADVRQQVTLANGYNNITVLVTNGEGNSPKLVSRYYAGFDTPVASGNVKTTVDASTGKVSVTWQAPDKGENGGYVGGVTYTIKRYPGGDVVAEGYQDTTYAETLPEGEYKTYAYSVTPDNHGVKGQEQRSNYVAYGSPITPPYSDGFDDEGEMAYFSVIDNDNDSVTWGLDEPRMANDYDGAACIKRGSDKVAFNDWLVSPALQLKANHQYRVSFRIRGWSKYYYEKVEVKYGTEPTAEGMTETLMEETTLKSSDYDTKSFVINADKDEVIYLGFHALTEKSEAMGIYIDDVYVTAGVDQDAPDQVTGLTAEPDAQGALSTKITFTAPTKTLSGGTLSKLTGFQLRRTGQVVAEIPAAEPGATVTFTDNTAKNGINVYSVAAVNENGASFYCDPVPVYVGEDAPTAPVKSNTETNDTFVRLNWTAPTVGTHGGYLNPDHMTYTVAEQGGSEYYTTYDAVGQVKAQTFFDYAVNTNDGASQDLMTLYVNATNDYGESSYAPLPSFIIGKPYDIPFAASVKNYMFYGILWSAWGTGKSDFDLSTESVDNDGGCFHVMPVDADDIAYIGSGKINLGGAAAPKLMFHYKATEGSGAKINVEVETPDGKSHLAGTIDCSQGTEGQWQAAGIDLSQWAGERFITFDFAVQGNAYSDVYIDRLFVRDTQTDDLNAEISAPESVKKGGKAQVQVRVNNFGENAAKKFNVSLYANDKLVETKKVTTPLAAYRFTDVVFDFQSNVLDQKESVELKAVVDYSYDLFEDDNTVSATVEYTTSDKPQPAAASAKTTTDGVVIDWTPVAATAETVTESFEEGTSWSQDSFCGFTSEAVNAGTTGGVFDNYSFPNQGSNYGFMLFDPTNGWLTEEQLDVVPDFKAKTGNKYLASLYRVDDYGYDVSQDNWLYSPELSGDEQEVSFWVKNYKDDETTYKETFDVLASTTDKSRESFTKVGDSYELTSGQWQKVKVTLPVGTKYFAINQNTYTWDSPFFFMIDDITYTKGAGMVKGYNVYRDGKLVGTVEAGVSTFTDNTVKADDGATYQYGVTAIYATEESEATLTAAVTPSGIDGVTAGDKTYDVYATDGTCVARNLKSLKLLKKGVYVVNGQKVIVK